MRANAVEHSTQPLTEHVRMMMMPRDLDPQIKAQLLKVPEQQFRHILAQYVQNARRDNGMAPFLGPQMGQTFNPQPVQPGMPQMLGGANMPRPGLNIGQQVPGAGPQLPMGQRPQQQQQQVNQQQRLATANHMLRQSPGIINATDSKPYPPNVLNAGIKANIPENVKTWGQLKTWAQQNPNMLPGVSTDKLVLLQALHFQDLVRQQQGGAPSQVLQQNNMFSVAQPPQMTPQGPIGTLQQQPNMPNGRQRIPSPQSMIQPRHPQYQPPHQQPSTNDRPFKCDQCVQSFRRNHDLKRHKRTHLAVKPFPCNHCDKSFSRKDALERHILIEGCESSAVSPPSVPPPASSLPESVSWKLPINSSSPPLIPSEGGRPWQWQGSGLDSHVTVEHMSKMALALRRPVISLAPQTKAQQQQSQEKLRKLHQQLGVHKNQRRSSTVDSKMTKFKYTISVDETIRQTSKHKSRFMALQ